MTIYFLDTAEQLARRLPDIFDPCCRMGCPTIETEHHIFVACPSFDGLHEDATKQLVLQIVTILDIFCIPTHLRHPITIFTKHALCDSDDWPAGLSLYYFGVMPKLDNLTSSLIEANISFDKLEHLRSRLAKTWHAIFVRLAGRIWGMVRRLSQNSSSLEVLK
ncbi:hypothetical protein H0H92_003159, partial [Tricholoma furcatifolium]